MITIKNRQRRFSIDSILMEEVVKKLLDEINYAGFDIGIMFVSSNTMRNYNKKYRNKDLPTDVLSFPFYPALKPRQRIKTHSEDEKNLGDIIICPDYVGKQLSDMHDWQDKSKSAQQVLLHARFVVLIIHGLCHLLGYDHETVMQYRSMRRKETSLLRKLR